MLKLAAVLVVAVLSLPAARADACKGKLSGAVTAEFTCSVTLRYRENKDVTHFIINAAAPPAGVKMLNPGAFDLAGKPKAGKLELAGVKRGAALVVTTDGKNYIASTTPSIGSLIIDLTKVDEPAAGAREHTASGSVTGELLDITTKQKVKLEVSF